MSAPGGMGAARSDIDRRPPAGGAACRSTTRVRRRRLSVLTATVCALALVATLTAGCGGSAPSISSITPSSGGPGTDVAVIGEAFGTTQGAGNIFFGNVNATVKSWTDTAITATVPKDVKEGGYTVTVATDGGTSDPVNFKVTAGGSSPESTPGRLEHTTPVAAMEAFLKMNGVDPSGMTFTVYSVSKSDPTWKIDQADKGGQLYNQFLLHQMKGDWTVVAEAKSFSTDDLKKYEAPSDLVAQTPPKPSEVNAIITYLQSKGMPADGWSLKVAKVSGIDSNWEIVKGTNAQTGQSDNFLLVWNGMLGDWQVLADGGPPWTGVDFKGETVPSDLETL